MLVSNFPSNFLSSGNFNLLLQVFIRMDNWSASGLVLRLGELIYAQTALQQTEPHNRYNFKIRKKGEEEQ